MWEEKKITLKSIKNIKSSLVNSKYTVYGLPPFTLFL